jgi:hypothetical protein
MRYEEEEDEVEGYTLGEFHALLSLLVDVDDQHKELIEKYFGNDMTPKQRMDYIKRLML